MFGLPNSFLHPEIPSSSQHTGEREGRAEMLLLISLSYTQPANTLKMISVAFPILCFTFDNIKIWGLGKGHQIPLWKMVLAMKDERSLRCLWSHVCGILRCCSSAQRNTYLWKLDRFSTQWPLLLDYIVPVLIPYRTGAFQQWLRRGCRV